MTREMYKVANFFISVSTPTTIYPQVIVVSRSSMTYKALKDLDRIT